MELQQIHNVFAFAVKTSEVYMFFLKTQKQNLFMLQNKNLDIQLEVDGFTKWNIHLFLKQKILCC